MILINIESLSDNELRNIAQQEDLADWENLSREDLIEGLEELYGEDRLIKLLSFGEHYPEPSGENGIPEIVCETVAADIEKFVNGAEQSDDITMLCIRYLG